MQILKNNYCSALGVLLSIYFMLSNYVCAAEIADAQKGFFSLSLKSLQKPEIISLDTLKRNYVLISFFEPECTWCYRQMVFLDHLQTQCGNNVQPILIGIHGTRQELQRDLRRALHQKIDKISVNIPAFEVSESLLMITGDITATPVTFVLNEQGKILQTLRGYNPADPVYSQLCPSNSLSTL